MVIVPSKEIKHKRPITARKKLRGYAEFCDLRHSLRIKELRLIKPIVSRCPKLRHEHQHGAREVAVSACLHFGPAASVLGIEYDSVEAGVRVGGGAPSG